MESLEGTVLADILAGVREDLDVRMAATSLSELKERAAHVAPAKDALATLRSDSVSVIAEVKRSSPSRGHLAAISDPAALARDYEAPAAPTSSACSPRNDDSRVPWQTSVRFGPLWTSPSCARTSS